MPEVLLNRRPHTPAPTLEVTPDMSLTLGRVHELCGNARYTLALMIAARTQGPVFWITPRWRANSLCPDGIAEMSRPQDLIYLNALRADDMLWSVEESLRSGAVALVIADLDVPPALTPVRRMHLAAEQGAAFADRPPLGLLLCPDKGGAPGIESRWHMASAHRAHHPGWVVTRLRARTAPVKRWDATRTGDRLTLHPKPWQDPVSTAERDRG